MGFACLIGGIRNDRIGGDGFQLVRAFTEDSVKIVGMVSQQIIGVVGQLSKQILADFPDTW